MLDWVGHHVDIAHWGLGFDDNGPTRDRGHGRIPARRTPSGTPAPEYRLNLKYPSNIEMIIAGGHPRHQRRHEVDRHGRLGAWVDARRLRAPRTRPGRRCRVLPDDQRKVKLYESHGPPPQLPRLREVPASRPSRRSRRRITRPCPATSGSIAMLVGRKIKWDAQQRSHRGRRGSVQAPDPRVPRAGSWRVFDLIRAFAGVVWRARFSTSPAALRGIDPPDPTRRSPLADSLNRMKTALFICAICLQTCTALANSQQAPPGPQFDGATLPGSAQLTQRTILRPTAMPALSPTR
ncbi:MAG: hypothetical protein MZU97_18595 [Bacillus subtilis]|nr:hypothetical protein [Bacillus subtilis]